MKVRKGIHKESTNYFHFTLNPPPLAPFDATALLPTGLSDGGSL